MKALIINCTLKPSPEVSNTEALANVVARQASRGRRHGGRGPGGRQGATPTWLARPASVTQRVLERMDAMIAQADDSGRPVAYGKVAGVVVTGNEDGAHRHEWSRTTGETAAQNLVAAAKALAEKSLPVPISS